MKRITRDPQPPRARRTGDAAKVLHCGNLGYKTVTKTYVFSEVCKMGKKLSFKNSSILMCLKNRQISETRQNQRKFPNQGNLSKDLSTGTVGIKVLEVFAFVSAANAAEDSL